MVANQLEVRMGLDALSSLMEGTNFPHILPQQKSTDRVISEMPLFQDSYHDNTPAVAFLGCLIWTTSASSSWSINSTAGVKNDFPPYYRVRVGENRALTYCLQRQAMAQTSYFYHHASFVQTGGSSHFRKQERDLWSCVLRFNYFVKIQAIHESSISSAYSYSFWKKI